MLLRTSRHRRGGTATSQMVLPSRLGGSGASCTHPASVCPSALLSGCPASTLHGGWPCKVHSQRLPVGFWLMRHAWGCRRGEFWDFLQDLHLPWGPLWSQCIPGFPLRLCLSWWPPPWVPDLVPPVSLCALNSQVLGSGHPFNHAGCACCRSSPADQLCVSAALSGTSSRVQASGVAASRNHRALCITTQAGGRSTSLASLAWTSPLPVLPSPSGEARRTERASARRSWACLPSSDAWGHQSQAPSGQDTTASLP